MVRDKNKYNKIKIALVANTSWYLYNFRSGLIRSLLESGYNLFVISPEDEFSNNIKVIGCKYFNLIMDNKGVNPISDYLLKIRLVKIYKKIKPDLILHYTLKPVLYGSMAATKIGIPFVNNITGLGSAFIKQNWITWIVKMLYRLSQKQTSYVFFQNADDMDLFRKEKLIPENVLQDIIPGTGINIDYFNIRPYPEINPVKFLFIGRLIWDKGVGELVEAARKIKSEFNDVKFQLLGFLNVKNRTSIQLKQIEEWEEEGVIEYLNETKDVRPHIENASCVLLPSYREGFSRTLIEAAAMGRPIIASNVAGCRDIVVDGKNGFLCKPRDSENLYEKIKSFLNTSFDQRVTMGLEGRRIIEEKYNEKIIVDKILLHLNNIINNGVSEVKLDV